ncbi:beta strand repeat-containing protein [Streptomyces angustmyceticus]|uniref:beta strand repeat-containing protein n=1 Tax=Streptomyces angustmyceticus TaxID=285578 RepID=UPI0021AEB2C6|nr:IPT/TIG domain-containing protein [Streptomyces angustmyceticus]
MAPVVTSISPAQGVPAGGTNVTLTGSGFTGATMVRFGPNGTTFVIVSDTQITAKTPAGSGTVQVTVTAPTGTSTQNVFFTYAPAPVLTTLTPTSGPTSGGNVVTLTGTNLTGATSVKFGSNTGVILTNTATQITVIAPAGPPSSVNVTVTTPSGTSNALPYTYVAVPAPTLTSLTPTSGSPAGGNVVTVTGTNLTGATSVKFGSNTGVILTNTATQITVIAPAGPPSSVNVTVTTAGGTSNGLPYTYVATPAPTLTTLNPTSGPTTGGNTITLTGTNLTGATSVKFGTNTGVILTNTATQITATAPPGTGNVNVTVTTAGGTSNALPYTYVATPAPTLTTLNPTSGPTAGGNTVTLTGTNLTGATAVLFGATPATILTNTATQITVTAPPGTGNVNVTVTTAGGTSNALPYSYVAAPIPTLSSLSPTSGPTSGGNVVTLNGSNLAGATSVKFGSNAATVLTNTVGQITVIAPAGPPSSVNVTVTTADGTSNPLPYFYLAAPTLSDLSPHLGPATGGNTVTVFGTNLTLTSAVNFGANPATAITVVSDNQLTVTAPAGTGTVVVTVTTPGGTSTAATGNPYYTYLGAPVLTSLVPSHGADLGGDAIVLSGSNLTYTDSVTFGGVPASFAAISDTQVVATSPGGAPGTVNVVAHTPAGNSNALPFVYDPS